MVDRVHDCIGLALQAYAKIWIDQTKVWPVEDSVEWREKVSLAMSSPETLMAWQEATLFWSGDSLKGQYFLFRGLCRALAYSEVSHSPDEKKEKSTSAYTPREAQNWRKNLIEQLEILSELIQKTPVQYSSWWNDYGDIEGERISRLQSVYMLPPALNIDLNNEGLQAALLPHDPIISMLESIKATKYRQGVTPLKPKSKYASRSYFIRSLAGILMPITDSWPDIVRTLAIGIFKEDLKPSQVITLADDIIPLVREKEIFEDFIYPVIALRENKTL